MVLGITLKLPCDMQVCRNWYTKQTPLIGKSYEGWVTILETK